jgi:hypothetical protein
MYGICSATTTGKPESFLAWSRSYFTVGGHPWQAEIDQNRLIKKQPTATAP